MGTVFKPRGGLVILRKVVHGRTKSGLVVSPNSAEGIDYIVVEKGPKVEDLQVGDKVLFVSMGDGTSKKAVNWDYIPGFADLIMINEQHVVLKMEEKEGEGEEGGFFGKCRVCKGEVKGETCHKAGDFVFHKSCFDRCSPVAQRAAGDPNSVLFD